MPVEIVNSTGNQSHAKYSFSTLFLGNNEYDYVNFKNTTPSAQITTTLGSLVYKTGADEYDIIANDATKIEDIVGILALQSDTILADDEVINVNIAIKGRLSQEQIVIPAGMSLTTLIPTTTRTLRDHLNKLGFHLITGTEHTKFDNE